jgi:hypothetical protein
MIHKAEDEGFASQMEDDDAKKPAPADDARLVEMKLARIAVPDRLIAWERSQSNGASSAAGVLLWTGC